MLDLNEFLPEGQAPEADEISAFERLKRTPHVLQTWAAFSEVLSNRRGSTTTREVLDEAILNWPDLNDLRLARCDWATSAGDRCLLRTDIDYLKECSDISEIPLRHLLALAHFEDDVLLLKTYFPLASATALENSKVKIGRLLFKVACRLGDIQAIQDFFAHNHLLKTKEPSLSYCVDLLFQWGHPERVEKLLLWASDSITMAHFVPAVLKRNRMMLQHSGIYRPILFHRLGLRDKGPVETEACTINLLDFEDFESGGKKVETIRAGYQALFNQDWQSATHIFETAQQSFNLMPRTNLKIDYLRGILQQIQTNKAPDRDLVQSHLDETEVIWSPCQDPQKISLFFLPGGSSFGRSIPYFLLDYLMASIGYGSVFIRDKKLLSGAGGLSTIAATAQASVDHLRKSLDTIGCEHPLVVGASGGGFGALHYGLRIRASRIIVFSGGTVGRSADMAALGDKRMKNLILAVDKLNPVQNFVGPVRKTLAEIKDPPPITMVYGGLSIGDRKQAEDLSDFQNVALTPIESSREHGTFFPYLIKYGPRGLTNQIG